MNKQIILLLLFVIIAASMFFAGRKYEARKNTIAVEQRNQAAKENAADRSIAGQISEIDENSLTIKTRDGASKKIFLSDNVIIRKTDDIKLSELNVGQQISARVAKKSDDEFQAQNISVASRTSE